MAAQAAIDALSADYKDDLEKIAKMESVARKVDPDFDIPDPADLKKEMEEEVCSAPPPPPRHPPRTFRPLSSHPSVWLCLGCCAAACVLRLRRVDALPNVAGGGAARGEDARGQRRRRPEAEHAHQAVRGGARRPRRPHSTRPAPSLFSLSSRSATACCRLAASTHAGMANCLPTVWQVNAARDKMLAVVEKFDLPTADSLLAPLVEARTAVQALAAKAKEKVRHAAHITPPAHATIDLCVPLRCSAALLPPCAALLHCCPAAPLPHCSARLCCSAACACALTRVFWQVPAKMDEVIAATPTGKAVSDEQYFRLVCVHLPLLARRPDHTLRAAHAAPAPRPPTPQHASPRAHTARSEPRTLAPRRAPASLSGSLRLPLPSPPLPNQRAFSQVLFCLNAPAAISTALGNIPAPPVTTAELGATVSAAASSAAATAGAAAATTVRVQPMHNQAVLQLDAGLPHGAAAGALKGRSLRHARRRDRRLRSRSYGYANRWR